MADGRNRRVWDHTSMIAAAALSSFRDKMIDPARLNPYEGKARRRGIPIGAGNIEILRALAGGDPPAQPKAGKPGPKGS
jgi:hypothetical protein